ncbi:MAG: NAD kinase [Actinomycetes bacterium]
MTAMTGEPRRVLLVAHTGRDFASDRARALASRLLASGLVVRALDDEAADLALPGLEPVSAGPTAADGCELVVVLGGDGTILRGAELARHADVPLLGVNLGRVGFLAEAEQHDLGDVADQVARRSWTVEERLALEVTVDVAGSVIHRDWALNEISLEKAARERMIEVLVAVDDRPLSRWGCDGVVVATPTGSTAYAFSAGGPVVWPEVEAMLVVPLSAHALFSRAMVVAPASTVSIELQPGTHQGVLWADGRRTVELPEGARVLVNRHPQPVRLARFGRTPFTERLVAKFALPVEGWRGSPPP